jgi:hypothetical protein
MKRLINHVSLTRRLRQLLVLFALLLLPAGMWAEDYNLWIGETQVTSENASNILADDNTNDGKVSFIASSNTLVLNGVETGKYIKSSLDNLIIKFSGTNKVHDTASYPDYDYDAIFSTVATATLTFVKDGDATLQLYAPNLTTTVIKGFASVSYSSGDGQCYLHSAKPCIYSATDRLVNIYDGGAISEVTISGETAYPLWFISNSDVATQVTSSTITANVTEGTVTFDSSNNKLSINGAIINGKILSALGNLTLDLQGANFIATTDSGSVVRSANAGTLTITETGENATLQLNVPKDDWNEYPVIQGFTALSYVGFNLAANPGATYGVYYVYDSEYDEYDRIIYGLYDSNRQEGSLKRITNALFTTANLYPVWVAGTQVSSDNKSDVLGEGKVSFNTSNNTLTLNGINITGPIFYNDAAENLTISLNGTNEINIDQDLWYSDAIVLSNNASSASLIIKKTDDAESCSLKVNAGNSDWRSITGFSDVTWTGLNAVAANTVSYDAQNRYLLTGDGSAWNVEFTTATAYNIVVDGVPVTSSNAKNVLGDVHASVSYSDGTLTLKGANIAPSSEDAIIIDEEVEALTVHLVGYNQIGAYGQYAFNLKGNTALTFTTSEKMPGSLVSSGNGGNVFNEEQQPSVTYQNGLALDANNTEIKAETGTMTVTGLTGAVSYVNSDNNGSAYMYSSPFPFEATKAEMSYGDAVVVSTPDNTTTTELWTSNIQSANVLKYTLQFDWGTCTNKNVTVQVVGYNQNEQTYDWEADGETYSSAVALSTADADGIIEIPLTKDVTSSQLRLRFSSDAAFSFVALSVGITQIVNYPVVVAGTQVTSKNASDVLGDKKISYDVETNTLTLNGATVGEDGSNPEPTIPEAPGISYSGTDDLTISLIGSNTIYGMGGCDAIRYSGEPGDNQPKLIFAKGDNQPCSLQLSAIETTVISSGFSQINGVNGINDTYAEALTLIFNKEVSYGSESDGLYYYNEEVSYPVTSAVITSGYGLTVGDVMVHEGNAADILDGDETNDGKVSYNATTNTLKLDGADLSGNGISYEGAEDLTIALKGNSQVFSISYTNNEAEDIPQLLFTKAEGATDCTLALNSKGDGSVIDGFSDIDYGTFNTMSSDPLKYGKMTPEEDYICLLDAITNDFMSELTITTATTYPLWVGGTQVTGTSVTADNIQRCGNYVDNEEYGITFTPGETNTLNLLRSGITIEESRKPAIVSSLDNLTIQLEGINNIIFNGEYSYYMIVSTDANATLTFKAVGDDAMLNANISESAYIGSPANGFKTVSYEDDLVYIANGTSTQTIKRIPAITFAGSNLWATYYSTENLKVPDGLTAYVVSAVNETTGAVTVTSIGYIPADEAILLQREENGAASGYTATAYTSQPTGFTNMLRGSEDDTSIEDGDFEGPVYVLFNDKFKRAISGTIPARRGFLVPGEMVAPGEAPQYLTISITDGNTTAIDTLTVDDNSNDSWYTIDGLKLNGKPQRKGLFINNGKKVYINNNK